MVWSSTPWGLCALFVAGVVIRVWLAPRGGHPGDLLVFQHWEDQLATQDWSKFTDNTSFIYYPFLYVLFVLGRLSRVLLGAPPSWTLLKIPPVLGDLGLAWVTGVLAQRLTPPSMLRRLPVRGLVTAAILLNPAVFFVSALWGQIDSIGALLALGSFLLIATGPTKLHRETLGIGLFALVLGIKPQMAVVVPLLVLILLRRHLFTEQDLDARGAAIAAARIGGLGLLGLAVILAVPAPFGLDPGSVVYYYRHAPSYAFTSVNAFNLWGALGFWRPDLEGAGVMTILGVAAFWVALVLFATGMIALLVRAWRALAAGESDGRVLVFGSAALTCLAFAVLTRIHERYLFFAIPCLAVFMAQRPLRRALLALSTLLLVNMYFPYVFFVERYGQTTWVKVDFLYKTLYGVDQDSYQKKILSVITAIVALAVAWFGWRWLATGAGSTRARGSWQTISAGLAKVAGPVRARSRESPSPTAGESPTPSLSGGGQGGGSPTTWWKRLAPLSLVTAACGFNLWVLRAESTPVHDLNDSSYHFAMLRWARMKIDQGKLPLDGWYPDLGLGLAQFHHYQSLPHVIGGYISVLVGEAATFYWLLYLLLALWPVSVYVGARLLGWDSWTAAAAALVSPVLVSVSGYGYEHGSYTWRGYGTWSQLWGMWLLPLAWGLTWRAVKGVGSFALGALAVALTVACHLLTGYLALLTIGVWALVTPSQLLARLRRAVIVGVGAVLVASWVIVPLLVDSAYASNTQFERGTIFYDSYGAPKVLGWLFTGQIFDNGRLPVVTLLVGVGLVVCAVRFRRDERVRAVVAVWLVSLLLFFGRPTLGPLLKLLPGSDDLPLHRYINGVHLGGILLAGIGAAWLGRWLVGLTRRYAPAVKPALAAAAVAILAFVALYPAWTQVAAIDRQGAAWIGEQVTWDASDGADLAMLVNRVKTLGPGRVYAGSSSNWGRQYQIGFVPVYAELQNYDVDTIGFWLRTESLSTDVEATFDESNPAQYDLFNIKYVIVPIDRQPPVRATLIARQGRHTLWQVDTSGYLEVVDSIGPPIVADRKDIGAVTAEFDRSQRLALHRHPMVAFDGGQAAAPTVRPGDALTGPAGTVELESSHPDQGSYSGEIVANRAAVVMLKTTFEPRWHVTVDGVDVPPQMIAPDFVGRTVPPGRHTISFRYVPFPDYPQLLTLGVLALVGLQFAPAAAEPARRRFRQVFKEWSSRPRRQRSSAPPP